uniref:Uncharacterized protein n=1 Tax=viral metagenome TaxID=1070528 RepID=A0A6M3J0G1_9ZZZZ
MADQPKLDPGVKLTVSVKERLMFRDIFPPKGNLLEMKIIRAIEKKIDFSVEELKEIGYANVLDDTGNPTNRVTWDVNKEKPLSIELSGIEIDLLKKVVTKLSDEGEIGREWMDLAIKIDEAKKDE